MFKKIGLIVLVFLPFVIVSCGKEVRTNDLATKGILKINFQVIEEKSSSKFRPTRVYFKKLDDSNDLFKGKIIASEIKDEDGNFYINYEPGTYVVVAVMRSAMDTKNVVFFDEAIIKKTKTDLNVGDDINIGDIFVVETAANLFGSADEQQNFNRDVIGKNLNTSMYAFRLATLDSRYKKEKTKKQEIIETQKVEEFK